jgi:hypothetical protein
LVQQRIELDTSIPLAYQARYGLNPIYVAIFKQDINKLLVVRFIQLMEEATWLSHIVVVPNKNGKLRFCGDFKKLNKATNKYLYPLSFFDEVLNIVAGYETYSFLDGYSGFL